MQLVIFRHEDRSILRAQFGISGPFHHQYGGSPRPDEIPARNGQPPAHLLSRLDARDPLLEGVLPRIGEFPLLCAIRYGACALGYRPTDSGITVPLHQEDDKPWEDFPYEGFPDALPAEPIAFAEKRYDPDDPEKAFYLSGLFGLDALTPEQFDGVMRYVEKLGWYSADYSDEETLEEYVLNAELPFLQGRPEDPCPDPGCPNRERPGSLQTFAIFEAGERTEELWGPYGEDLQIIYQRCLACGAVLVTNQCT